MDLSFSLSPGYLALIIPVAAALAWWMYRGTKDLLPAVPRVLLGIFRFLALTLLAILLLQPLLTNNKLLVFPPIVSVLQDNSESLIIQKDSSFVKNEFPSMLGSFFEAFENESESASLFAFDSELRKNVSVDSISFDQTGTNISQALEQVSDFYQNQNLGALVLVSDGITTAGSNPLYAVQNFRQPVFTVLLGDTTPQKDILIKEVLFNEIAYLNNQLPVRVKVRSDGFDQANLTVTLKGHGKTLGTKKLSLGRTRAEGEVEFLFKPEETGLQQYTITISRKEGEITYLNNFRRIFVNVLETRVKIALLAGAPHPDLGALQQAFAKEESYELSKFILKSPTTFYESPLSVNWDDFDLFILHNFPNSGRDNEVVKKLLSEIKDNKKPVLYFVGAFTDLRAMNPLYEYMAVKPGEFSPRSEEVFADFDSRYKVHSTYTFGDAWLTWVNSAPPLYRNNSNWQAKSTAEVFATARIKNVALDYPVFVLQNHLGRKNAVFLGENFWRMRAHSYLESQDFELFDGWLFNLIKWLMVEDDKRKFRVSPSKKVFSGSEPVIFKGQAYDESYNPISGVDIKLVIKNPDGKENEYFLNETGNGRYFLELYNFSEGTFRYEAEGRKDNVRIGTDRGQFSIGRSNVEHFQLRADQDLLQQIALRTGGEFLYARDLESLPEKIKSLPGFKPIRDYKKQRSGLQQYFWPMLLILLLLSVEWITRKIYSLL